ncbi:MAG: hypothetical protein JXR88_10885 [Clostridia bacterium]|nr:hypothetical protein [Clostridia bacterium]
MRINPIASYIPVQELSIEKQNNQEGVVRPKKNEAVGPIQPGNKSSEYIESLKAAYGEKQLKKMGVIECATCANRTYVDGSDDPGVSFKTPGKIAPEVSASVVMSHEQEHVSNEQASAQSEGREVVSQSVTLQNGICPECGRVYVAGGTTRTVTKAKSNYDISDVLLEGAKLDKKA